MSFSHQVRQREDKRARFLLQVPELAVGAGRAAPETVDAGLKKPPIARESSLQL
eukprot:COSAG06_NODE_28760_length_568_cov_3.479744_1_plen_53_part_01